MSGARAIATVLVSLLLVSAARAALPLDLRADATLGDETAVRVTATNRAATAITDVRAEVAFERQTRRADPLPALAAGETHAWTFALPPPPGPGTFAVTVRTAYRLADRPESAILVHVVATPGAPPGLVETALDLAPLAGYAHGRLTLDNPSDHAMLGRVILLLPAALDTEPESRPVAVAAHGRTEVPFDVRDRGAAPGESYPVSLLFDYETDGVHHAALREATLAVLPAAHPPVRPLVVGGLALVAAIAVLAGALRHTHGAGAV